MSSFMFISLICYEFRLSQPEAFLSNFPSYPLLFLSPLPALTSSSGFHSMRCKHCVIKSRVIRKYLEKQKEILETSNQNVVVKNYVNG